MSDTPTTGESDEFDGFTPDIKRAAEKRAAALAAARIDAPDETTEPVEPKAKRRQTTRSRGD